MTVGKIADFRFKRSPQAGLRANGNLF